jgi:hypothetical protein
MRDSEEILVRGNGPKTVFTQRGLAVLAVLTSCFDM